MKNTMKLELMKQEDFLGVKCDFYKDEENNVYMTREQIGQALQYASPQKAIDNIHARNKDRLDRFSVNLKLRATDQKEYKTNLYIEKGIYDVCRFSRQPVADEFYDWTYDQIELIRKTGGTVQLGSEKEFLDNYFPSLSENTKLMLVQDLNKSIKEQQDKINELQPKADDWTAFMDSKGNLTMANVAKSLNIKGIGRNNLFKILKEREVLRHNNEPYQEFIDRGYFEVLAGVKNGFKINQTVVTGKGMSWINKKVRDWGII